MITRSGPHEVMLSQPPSLLPLYLRAALPLLGGQGSSLPEVVFRLKTVRPDVDEVTRYAAVVGARVGDRLPLLYPHLIGFPLQLRLMTDRAFPFPAMGLLHLTNEVTTTRVLRLGEPLDLEVYAGAVYPHSRGRLIDLITVARQDGEAVWTGVSSYLRREKTPRPTEPTAGQAPVPATGQTPERTGEPFPDLPDLSFSARWHLADDLGRRYASVSGDRNPIHLHPLMARPLGFPRAIAHGMWTAAAMVAALEGRLPDAGVHTVQFRRPIPLPSTVRLFTAVRDGAAAAEVRGRDGDDTVHVSTTVVAR